jgi:hypothetical protein
MPLCAELLPGSFSIPKQLCKFVHRCVGRSVRQFVLLLSDNWGSMEEWKRKAFRAQALESAQTLIDVGGIAMNRVDFARQA